jgi:hypothetical protein
MFLERVENSIKTDIKAFWRYTKSKNTTNVLASRMYYESVFANNGSDIANLFAKHFSSVYNKPSNVTYEPNFPESNRSISSITITEHDIVEALESIDIHKGAGPDGVPPVLLKECRMALAKPLFLIYNHSLNTGCFPELWKIARIVPVYKSGNKMDVSNFRPISILSCFAKIFESLVYKHLYHYLKPVISEKQHGFISGRSTTTNLLTYIHDLNLAFNVHVQVDSLYSDFSKAFDKVDHHILCSKARHLGIHGVLLRWLISYLSRRTQLVAVHGFESGPYESTSGIPQGSNLGPLLFIMFINDLLESVTSNCIAYADDIKIYREVTNIEDAMLLQNDIDKVYDWCVTNGMSLNISKCCLVTFTKKKFPVQYSYKINNIALHHQSLVKDLGVWLDSKLSYTYHYEQIISKVNKTIGFIMRIAKPFRKPPSSLILYCALIRSVLEYNSIIWCPQYQTHIDRLEAVQRRFLRHLSSKMGMRRRLTTYEARLQYFGLEALQFRRLVQDQSILYKIINGQWDAAGLLSHLSFTTGGSKRIKKLFFVPNCNNNVTFNDPLFRMCRYYNESLKDVDVFSLSLGSFVNAVKQQHNI